jgi:hypothetical protein
MSKGSGNEALQEGKAGGELTVSGERGQRKVGGKRRQKAIRSNGT